MAKKITRQEARNRKSKMAQEKQQRVDHGIAKQIAALHRHHGLYPMPEDMAARKKHGVAKERIAHELEKFKGLDRKAKLVKVKKETSSEETDSVR